MNTTALTVCLALCGIMSQSAGAQTDVRLVSRVNLEYDGVSYVPRDSTTYSYSGSRGGFFDDHKLEWNWKPDLQYRYSYIGVGGYVRDQKISLTYDASDKLISQIFDVWSPVTLAWETNSKKLFTYDAPGNLVSILALNWDGTSTWENATKIEYTYTIPGEKSSYADYSWNATASTWSPNFWHMYKWDGLHRCIGDSAMAWSSSAWQSAGRVSYNYDGAGNRTTNIHEQIVASSWQVSGKYENSGFVSHHQPQTATYMSWDATASTFKNERRETYVYNSYGKPEYFSEEKWNAAISAWQPEVYSKAVRYYYETYTPSGVVQPAGETTSVTLFPVPASDDLTIDVSGNAERKFSVAISDICGKTLRSWNVAETKHYHERIPIHDLPPGNYILTLSGEGRMISKQFSVVR